MTMVLIIPSCAIWPIVGHVNEATEKAELQSEQLQMLWS